MNNKAHPLFFITIVFMNMLGLLASDIYLPAMPQLTGYFHTSAANIQLTLSLYLCSFGFSMLLYNPFADRYGRKRILLIGQGIFLIGTFLAMISSDIEMLLIARLLQGFGASSGLALSSPIILELFGKERAARLLNTILPLMAVSPAAAPVIGGFLARYINWQATFTFMLGIVITLLILTKFLIPCRKPITDEIKARQTAAKYITLLKDKQFILYLIIACTTTSIWLSYLILAPFILAKLDYSQTQIGLVFATLAIAYISGNYILRRLLPKTSLKHYLSIGTCIITIGIITFLILYKSGINGLSLSLIPMLIIISGNGIVMPAAISLAITHIPQLSGYASALVASSRMLIGSLLTLCLGRLFGNTIDTMLISESVLTVIVISTVAMTYAHSILTKKTNIIMTKKREFSQNVEISRDFQ